MLLEVDKLGPDWTPTVFIGGFDDPELTEQIQLDGPVEMRVEVSRRGRRIQLRGNLRATGMVECGRCLEPTPVIISAPFDVVFEPETGGSDHDVEVAADNLGVAELAGDTIDLKDFAREQLILNLPVRVLCREDCLGFCPTCGANRNLQPCECASDAIDPRWQALQGILGEKQ